MKAFTFNPSRTNPPTPHWVRANHAALIASVTVHVVTVQTELGRWMGDVGAIWGFEVVVSATAEAAIGRTLPGRPG